MMHMYNSPQGEQNPDAVFQGLGLRGWLRLVLRTRAGTIRQCDATIEQMFGKLNDACLDAANAARSAKIAEEAAATAQRAAQKFAQLVLIQNEALVAVKEVIEKGCYPDDPAWGPVITKIADALEAAKEHL